MSAEKYTDLMVDIETFGLLPGSAVLSIGAVPFSRKNDHVSSETFEMHISLNHSVRHDQMDMDAGTMNFWLSNPKAAKATLVRALAAGDSFARVISCLRDFIEEHTVGTVHVCPWANGAAFDFPVLAMAAHKAGCHLPWSYKNERCYRTVKEEYQRNGVYAEVSEIGQMHTALADADYQARKLVALYQSSINNTSRYEVVKLAAVVVEEPVPVELEVPASVSQAIGLEPPFLPGLKAG